MVNEVKPTELRAVAGVCVLAAFADGAQSDSERARIQKIVNDFPGEPLDLPSVYQDALCGKFTRLSAAAQLQSPASRALAYEMAVGVCTADGPLNDAEKRFLEDLHRGLGLQAAKTGDHFQTAQALAVPPVIAHPPAGPAGREADVDRMILNAAILNGALEMMPHTLATMAIVPLQMRLVYRVGQAYGFELDRGHIMDFLATVGVGLTSQVFEGFAQQLAGRFARRLTGGLLGGLIGQTAGSAIGFASTYAVGQAAKQYYAGGRRLSPAQLKGVFTNMLASGRSMQGGYQGDITRQASQTNLSDILTLTKQA